MGLLKHTTELSVRISKIFTIQTPLERSSSIPLGFARQVERADFRPAWGLNCLRSWPSLPFPTLRRSLSPIPLASLSSLLMWKMCKYTHLAKLYVYMCVYMLVNVCASQLSQVKFILACVSNCGEVLVERLGTMFAVKTGLTHQVSR